MRDLLSKLDAIISETALKDKEDLDAKRQALDDLESDPVASSDPEISAAIDQRRSDLEKEAESKGFTESEDVYQVGDDFGISFSEDFEIATEIVDIVEDGIVIDLDETALEFLTQNGFTFEDVELAEEKQKGLDGKACWKGYRRMGTKMKGGKRVDNCVKVSEGFGSLEEKVKELLDRFEKDAMEIGGYGDPDIKEIVKHLENGDAESAAEVVWYAYSDQDGGEFPEKEPLIDDLEAEFEELAQGGDEDEVDEAEYQGRKVPLGKPMAGDVKKSKVYVKNPQGRVVKVNFGDKKMRIKKSNPNRRKSFRARHNCANPGPRHKARYWSCRAW